MSTSNLTRQSAAHRLHIFSYLILPSFVMIGAGCNWSELSDQERAGIRSALSDQKPIAVVQTYDDLAKMKPDDIRKINPLYIDVLILEKNVFPFPDKQFSETPPDRCETAHYHGTVGLTLDLNTVQEPHTPCGFGNELTTQEVDAEAVIQWFWKYSTVKK